MEPLQALLVNITAFIASAPKQKSNDKPVIASPTDPPLPLPLRSKLAPTISKVTSIPSSISLPADAPPSLTPPPALMESLRAVVRFGGVCLSFGIARLVFADFELRVLEPSNPPRHFYPPPRSSNQGTQHSSRLIFPRFSMCSGPILPLFPIFPSGFLFLRHENRRRKPDCCCNNVQCVWRH